MAADQLTASFADEHLRGPRQEGACRTFGGPGTDLTIGLDFTWQEVSQLFADDWRPDFLALNLAYTSIPEAVWQSPLPRVGLAADANLLWHAYRLLLPLCDFILTDNLSVERLRQAGYEHAMPTNLYGLGRSFLGILVGDRPRDIDVLFVSLFPQPFEKRIHNPRIPFCANVHPAAWDNHGVAVRTNSSAFFQSASEPMQQPVARACLRLVFTSFQA
jgi:hypothetical protein